MRSGKRPHSLLHMIFLKGFPLVQCLANAGCMKACFINLLTVKQSKYREPRYRHYNKQHTQSPVLFSSITRRSRHIITHSLCSAASFVPPLPVIAVLTERMNTVSIQRVCHHFVLSGAVRQAESWAEVNTA